MTAQQVLARFGFVKAPTGSYVHKTTFAVLLKALKK